MQYRAAITPLRDVLKQYRVVKRLSAVFDVTLGPLGLITAGLLIVELLVSLSSPWDTIVYGAQVAIWVIFLLAFVIEMSVAPKKLTYLRRNWLLVLALIIPALRIFRVAQAVRILQSGRVIRGARLVRGFTSLKRGVEAIEGFLGFSQTAFMAALTGFVWLASAGLVLFLESGSGSAIDSAGEALWWAATVLTTVAVAEDPVSTEGRVVALALRVFGVAVIGYFTARLAAYFLGMRGEDKSQGENDLHELHREVVALRAELRVLRNAGDGP